MKSMYVGKMGAYALGTLTGLYAIGAFLGLWFLDVETFLTWILPVLALYWLAYHMFWKKHVGLNMPAWMSYTSGWFIVIFILWLARGMLYEPVKIPSESMRPNLIIGDVLLINRHAYQWRVPGTSWILHDVRKPNPGEMLVFRAPFNRSMYLMKRVMATEGQTIRIERATQRVFVNGDPYPVRPVDPSDFGVRINEHDIRSDELALMERVGDHWHPVLYNKRPSASIQAMSPNEEFQKMWSNACVWTAQTIECTIPRGHFFAMGDNRDNSADSRTWGFARNADIIGPPATLLFNNDHWFGRTYGLMP